VTSLGICFALIKNVSNNKFKPIIQINYDTSIPAVILQNRFSPSYPSVNALHTSSTTITYTNICVL